MAGDLDLAFRASVIPHAVLPLAIEISPQKHAVAGEEKQAVGPSLAEVQIGADDRHVVHQGAAQEPRHGRGLDGKLLLEMPAGVIVQPPAGDEIL